MNVGVEKKICNALAFCLFVCNVNAVICIYAVIESYYKQSKAMIVHRNHNVCVIKKN